MCAYILVFPSTYVYHIPGIFLPSVPLLQYPIIATTFTAAVGCNLDWTQCYQVLNAFSQYYGVLRSLMMTLPAVFRG